MRPSISLLQLLYLDTPNPIPRMVFLWGLPGPPGQSTLGGARLLQMYVAMHLTSSISDGATVYSQERRIIIVPFYRCENRGPEHSLTPPMLPSGDHPPLTTLPSGSLNRELEIPWPVSAFSWAGPRTSPSDFMLPFVRTDSSPQRQEQRSPHPPMAPTASRSRGLTFISTGDCPPLFLYPSVPLAHCSSSFYSQNVHFTPLRSAQCMGCSEVRNLSRAQEGTDPLMVLADAEGGRGPQAAPSCPPGDNP